MAIAVALLLLLTPGSSLASGARASATLHPTTSPVLTWEVPVRISNAQSSPTGTYQQMVILNSSHFSAYINANESNVAWRYPNGTAIYAWMESNNSNTSTHTTWWLRLYNIPADSNQVVYLDVYGETSFLLSEAGPTGEAPQLSVTYGGLDDGATVFAVYWNFSGTYLPSSWFFGGADVVNNGLIQAGDFYHTLPFAGGAFAVDTYIAAPSGVGWDVLSSVTSPAVCPDAADGCSGLLANPGPSALPSQYYAWWTTNTGISERFAIASANPKWTANWTVFTATFDGEYINFTWNYSTAGFSAQNSTRPPTPAYVGWQNWGGLQGSPAAYWVRLRPYLPNGVMPTVTFLRLPAPVSALKAIPGPTWIVWTWTDPTLAQSYGSLVNTTLFVGPACGDWANVTSLGSTEFNSTDLVPSAQYCASVEVWNQNGSSFNNPTLLASTLTENVTGITGSGPPPPPAPSAPPFRALEEIAAGVVVAAVVLVLFAWYREHKDDTVHRTRSPKGHVSRRP